MNKQLWAVCAAAVVAMVGCSKSEGPAVEAKADADNKSVEVEYSYNRKNEFVANLKNEAKEVNRELEKMGDKIKAESKPRWEALKAKAKNLDVEINRAENSTESTWDSVRASSKKAFAEVKEGFNEAREWTAEKIAP